MKIRVACKILVHGEVFGKHGEIVDVPPEVAAALIKAGKAETIKTEKKP